MAASSVFRRSRSRRFRSARTRASAVLRSNETQFRPMVSPSLSRQSSLPSRTGRTQSCKGHPGHDRRGLIRAQASSGQLWLKNRLGDHAPGCAQLEPSPRLVAISRSALWRRATPSAIVFCRLHSSPGGPHRPPAAQRTSWKPIGGMPDRQLCARSGRTLRQMSSRNRSVMSVLDINPHMMATLFFVQIVFFPGIQT